MLNSKELAEAARGHEDLEADLPGDVRELQELCESYTVAEAEVDQLNKDRAELLRKHYPGFDDDMKRLGAHLARTKERVKELLLKYSPSGGIGVRLGRQRFAVKNAATTLVVDHDALTARWIEDLSAIDVDGRPLIVPTLDERYLAEAIRREYVDQDELIEAGILRIKQNTPAWHHTGSGSRHD